MNTKTSRESFNNNPRGMKWAGLLGLLMLAPVGCGPEESQPSDEGGSGVMASYRGTQVSLRWLLENRQDVSCDDHLGAGIFSCYDSHAEMMANIKRGNVSAQSCGGPGTLYATAWENYGFSGASLALYYDYENLGPIWNDRISSVQIIPGCSASFYQNASYNPGVFSGPAIYTSDSWYVGVYNDQFSSVRRGG